MSALKREQQTGEVFTPRSLIPSGGVPTSRGMKFSNVVGNPPYKAGMHLEFMEVSLNLLEKNGTLIFVHPAEWLVHKRNTDTGEGYRALRDRLSNYHTDITFIDNPWPQEARLYVPLTVTCVSPGAGVTFTDSRTRGFSKLQLSPKETLTLNSLHDVTQWGHPAHVSSFLEKVNRVATVSNWWQHVDKAASGDWYVNLCTVAGDGKTVLTYGDGVTRTIYNMFSVVNESTLSVTTEPLRSAPRGGKNIGNEKLWFAFNNEQHAAHAMHFISRTKFVRALLALIKINQHVLSGRLPVDIPWLDWSEEWTDAKLSEFFGLTTEEVATIDEIVDAITL